MRHPANARGSQNAIELLIGPGVATRPLPSAAARHFDAGLRALAREALPEAVRHWRDAVRIAPQHPECHAALGLAAARAGDAATALHALRNATTLAPSARATWRLRADCALLLGANSDAFEALRQLVRIDPDDMDALGSLGALYRQADEPAAALRALHRVLERNPRDVRALSNTALVFLDLGEFTMAQGAARAAIAIDPHHRDAKWNLALLELLHGDFERGWASHECRAPLRVLEASTRAYQEPRWHGEALDGALYIWPEQGLGDVMQFVRFVPEAAQRVGARGRTMVAVPAPLLELVRASLPHTIDVLDADAPPPAFVAHVPLLSLPYAMQLGDRLGSELVPYLHPSGTRPRVLDELLPHTRSHALRVGIVWAGQPRHSNDRNRSMSFELIHELADLPGIDLLALQKGVGEDVLEAWNQARQQAGRRTIPPLASHCHSFADTAHAVAQLDLVITVDTAVAHLAGAMGRETWVLIPFIPDWRWQIERDDSPWYPHARLFRQPKTGDWASVVGQVSTALREKIAHTRLAA
jgi:tetratricopeptide (TPR) repeat protein